MNYFDYIDDLNPDINLKSGTKSKVMLEISKQNTQKSNTKKAYISIAACFIILFGSIITFRALTKNSDTISVNTAPDSLMAGPQSVLIDNKLYLQYWREEINEEDNDNEKIVINKTDIGELVCTINEYNLVDGINMKFLKALDIENAKQNKFYNAKVYKLINCKNDTVLLVKRDVNDEYYFFCLKGLNSKNTASEIIDIFTAGERNPIKYVNVFQHDVRYSNTESYIKKATIQDSETIGTIIDILRSCNTSCNVYDIVSKGLAQNEFTEDEYLLEIVFADNTKLKVYLFKEYFNFFITQEDEYDYYLFSGSEYYSLLELFNREN